MSTKVNKATVQDMIETNKSIKKAIGEKVTLQFEKLKKTFMKVFSDASLGNSSDGGSTQGGYFICLQDEGNDNIVPLSWT